MDSAARAKTQADRRQEIRRRVNYPAQIDRADGSPWLECVISDISILGARLNVQAGDRIPEQFVLMLSRTGTGRRACRMIWRSKFEIGVQFVPDEQPALTPVTESKPQPAPSPVTLTAELDC